MCPFYIFLFRWQFSFVQTVQCLHVVKTVTTLQAYSMHQARTMWSEKKRYLCRQLVAHCLMRNISTTGVHITVQLVALDVLQTPGG